MKQNYWVKDDSRSEIITKTRIPNKNNYDIFGCYFNLMDKRGLSIHFNESTKIETDKLFTKNNFQYFVLAHDNVKELLILPNENLIKYTQSIISKIDQCQREIDLLDLIIEEM